MMSGGSRSKRAPALTAYLAAASAARNKRVAQVLAPRLVAAVASAVPAGMLGYFAGGGLWGWVMGNATMMGVAAWAVVSGLRASRQTDPILQAGEEASRQLERLRSEGKLFKHVDPRALMALESCAHHWHRIRSAVTGPAWKADVPSHWEMVRLQGATAADVAISEALALASTCVGEPVRSKERDLADALTDLVSLEIGSALAGLRDMAQGSWTKYAHQSPSAPVAVPRMLEIAHSLGMLASELESANAKLAVQGTLEGRVSERAIEMAISELRMIQSAETEVERLDQR